MEVLIINWEEAGMPEEMKNNLGKLAAERIQKLTDKAEFKAVPGAQLEILYSESDPLMTKENWGEDAYALYFTVKESVSQNGFNTIKLELNF